MSNYKATVADQKDHDGLNIVLYCIQEYSWDCLTEIVDGISSQVLEKADESTQLTPEQYAKSIGYEKAYEMWAESLHTGDQIDWATIDEEEERRTMLMFHGTP